MLAESPVLRQISVPFFLKEREKLGKFYLFNGSAACFLFKQGSSICLLFLCAWKYHSGFDPSNNKVISGFLVCNPPPASQGVAKTALGPLLWAQ